jgi:hypothetical protein
VGRVWGIRPSEESVKVKSVKGVGNRPSEESMKVSSVSVKGGENSRSGVKWADRSRAILLERER